MKIIIDIPRKTYEHIRSWGGHGIFNIQDNDNLIVTKAIFNGTPLPEMYGRLGDLDELEQRINNFIEYDAHMQDEYTLIRERFILDGIRQTHTIIEADKEAENESNTDD